MDAYLINVALTLVPSLIFVVVLYFIMSVGIHVIWTLDLGWISSGDKKKQMKRGRNWVAILIAIGLSVNAFSNPAYTYKHETYNHQQRAYEDSRYSDRNAEAARGEIRMDNIQMPKESWEEREERTQQMLDWKNRD